VLILAGSPQDATPFRNDTPYELSFVDGTLFVNSCDSYDKLPEKIVRGFTSIRDEPELQHITHVLKVDDTSIEEFPKYFSALALERALAGADGDYFSSLMGYMAIDCAEPHPYCEARYHLQHAGLAESSSWYDRSYHFPQINFSYASGGGGGYLVSRRALGLVADQWPLHSMEELSQSNIYEDALIGETLFRAGVHMRCLYVDVAKGHSDDILSWWGVDSCGE
jgi:hypothetical protein